MFALGLTTSTCGFILLGALGQRYATIAFGALLIAVYTMLGTAMYDARYQQPLLLVIGALWYNLLTLAGHLLFLSGRCKRTARCYDQLANYLDAKANLFDPDAERDADLPRMDVAMANSALVALLNQTKASLLTRLKGDRGQRGTRRTLHYYFCRAGYPRTRQLFPRSVPRAQPPIPPQRHFVPLPAFAEHAGARLPPIGTIDPAAAKVPAQPAL